MALFFDPCQIQATLANHAKNNFHMAEDFLGNTFVSYEMFCFPRKYSKTGIANTKS
jgi:hypothetical protein